MHNYLLVSFAQRIPLTVTPIAEPNDILGLVRAFVDFWSYALLAALCIAVATAGINHLASPLIRMINQHLTVTTWLRRRKVYEAALVIPAWLANALTNVVGPLEMSGILKRAQKAFRIPEMRRDRWPIWSADALRKLSGLQLDSMILRDELFMHAIQTEVRAAVAHPTGNPKLFRLVMDNAPATVRGALAVFDQIASERPEVAIALSEWNGEERDWSEGVEKSAKPRDEKEAGRNPVPAALSADERIAKAAVEHALDELQLALMAKAVSTYRFTSVGIGVALAAAAGIMLQLGEPLVFLAIGAAGGSLSLFISDAGAALLARLSK